MDSAAQQKIFVPQNAKAIAWSTRNLPAVEEGISLKELLGIMNHGLIDLLAIRLLRQTCLVSKPPLSLATKERRMYSYRYEIVDALTHLNYAFAYIDPQSFDLVTMDQQTPAELFQEVADVKRYKSDLQVWVSVGGWTFSDNGTAMRK